ncbi:VOC family protein [Paenibacillus sp. strain BS8-2]
MKITEVTFLAIDPLELLPFYRDGLRFPVVSASDEKLVVDAGATRICFIRREPGSSDSARESDKPYYHFAFNIPENKLAEAKRWAESFVELGREAGNDISHSDAWNSDSVYFMDPGGNILELIARHTMDNAIDRPFDPERDIEGLSEIGLPTKDVPAAVDQLEAVGIRSYQGRSDSFNPVGDEEGMFIVVQPGRRWHFTNLTAEIYPFTVVVDGIGGLRLTEDEQGLVIEKDFEIEFIGRQANE